MVDVCGRNSGGCDARSHGVEEGARRALAVPKSGKLGSAGGEHIVS
jgi:hypothetical protein